MSTGTLGFAGTTITRNDGSVWTGVSAGDTVDVWGAADAANNRSHTVNAVAGNQITVAAATTTETNSPALAYRQRAKFLALDVYWICAGTHYELVSCESDQQVTLMILTPSPKFSRNHGHFGPVGGPPDLERIWVSKTSNHAGPGEVRTQVPGGGMDGVITVQLADHDIEDTYEGF